MALRLDETITQTITDALWQTVETLLDRKLEDVNAADAAKIKDALMAQLRAGATEPFRFDASQLSRSVSLAFDDADLRMLDDTLDRMVQMLPAVLDSTAAAVAEQKYPEVVAAWPKLQRQERRARRRFDRVLLRHWGRTLNLLDLLLSLSRERGEAITAIASEEPSVFTNVCAHLHARIMLVASECASLLNQGYADGALARWRTVHETTIVLVLMVNYGDVLAERYIDHEAVDVWHEYVTETAAAGLDLAQALRDDPDAQVLRGGYDAALAKHGSTFKGTYGWAKGIIPRVDGSNNAPGFSDLAAAAGRAAEADDYKFASYHIHPTARSVDARLGMLGYEGLLTGPSSAGLEVPAAYVADSLVLAMAYYGHDALAMESNVAVRLAERIRDELIEQAIAARDRLIAGDGANAPLPSTPPIA